MKKPAALSLLCVFLTTLTLQSQEWAPLGAEWKYRSELSPTNEVSNQLIRIENDTIVAGFACRKYVIYNGFSPESSVHSVGYTFEHNDSIFIWDENNFLLRYDFSASVGDTITIPSPSIEITEGESTAFFSVVLDSIATENIGFSQTPLQRYYTHAVAGSLDYYDGGYYRTIGSKNSWGGLTTNFILVGLVYEDLLCYKDDQLEIFVVSTDCQTLTANEEIPNVPPLRIYPNPAGNYLHLQWEDVDDINWSFVLYNSVGKEVVRYSSKTATNSQTIPVGDWPAGQYYLKVVNSKGQLLRTYPWVKL